MQTSGKNEAAIIRSSAAGGCSETSVEMRYEDENIWLIQKMMACNIFNSSLTKLENERERIKYENDQVFPCFFLCVCPVFCAKNWTNTYCIR